MRHKWAKGGKGWWYCERCGLTREKHFGMPYIYYFDSIRESREYIKAPPCTPKEKKL